MDTSLKIEYRNSQFPSLGGRGNSDEGFGNMEEYGDDKDNKNLTKNMKLKSMILKKNLGNMIRL